MNGSKTQNTLKNNNAGRDIAGRDVNNTTNYNFTPPNQKSSLRIKIEELQLDSLHDPHFKECINRLSHYLNLVKPDEQRDLKAKLTDAGRETEIFEAQELKERFVKSLLKNNLSEQAQEAYVHILAKLLSLYELKVRDHIIDGAPRQVVNAEILNVIEIICGDLVGTLLEKDYKEVQGMIYFLGGNCHLEWKY